MPCLGRMVGAVAVEVGLEEAAAAAAGELMIT